MHNMQLLNDQIAFHTGQRQCTYRVLSTRFIRVWLVIEIFSYLCLLQNYKITINSWWRYFFLCLRHSIENSSMSRLPPMFCKNLFSPCTVIVWTSCVSTQFNCISLMLTKCWIPSATTTITHQLKQSPYYQSYGKISSHASAVRYKPIET